VSDIGRRKIYDTFIRADFRRKSGYDIAAYPMRAYLASLLPGCKNAGA